MKSPMDRVPQGHAVCISRGHWHHSSWFVKLHKWSMRSNGGEAPDLVWAFHADTYTEAVAALRGYCEEHWPEPKKCRKKK